MNDGKLVWIYIHIEGESFLGCRCFGYNLFLRKQDVFICLDFTCSRQSQKVGRRTVCQHGVCCLLRISSPVLGLEDLSLVLPVFLLGVVHFAPVAAAKGGDLGDLEVGVLGLGEGTASLVHPEHVGARGALLARGGGGDGVGVSDSLGFLQLGGLLLPRLLHGGGHTAPDLTAEGGDGSHLHLGVALLGVLATLLVHPEHVGGLGAALARLGGVDTLLGALQRTRGHNIM